MILKNKFKSLTGILKLVMLAPTNTKKKGVMNMTNLLTDNLSATRELRLFAQLNTDCCC
jgi:hypothetical protein